MRIILNEMKKIWNWKILVIIGVGCAMFYIMFMSYHIDYYKKGNHPHAELVFYAEELTRRYGSTVTEEQLAEFITVERAALVAEANEYIRTMPEYAEAGVYSYDDYLTLTGFERDPHEDENSATQTLSTSWVYGAFFMPECKFIGYRFYALESYETSFDWSLREIDNPDSYYYLNLTEKEQARFRENVESGANHSAFSWWTYDCTRDYVKSFSVLLMLAVLALISPLITNDRHRRLHYLQYSSKQGRKISRAQLAATLLSAFALTTLLILVFSGIFSQNGTVVFWNNPIWSDYNSDAATVFNLTYGEWLIITAVLMYALALGVSMFAFILSRFSGNLITLMMKLIPVFAVIAYLSVSVFNGLFSMGNTLYSLLRFFGTEIYVCAVVVVIALAAVVFVIRRERRVDVM